MRGVQGEAGGGRVSEVEFWSWALDTPIRFGPSRVSLVCPFCREGGDLVVDPELDRWMVTDPVRAMVTMTAFMRQHADRHADCAPRARGAPETMR